MASFAELKAVTSDATNKDELTLPQQ
ncbi:hypothetical protein BN1708_005481 [Verticillium longisporum]|uniref:Uncharacterized protein n=1 Tax=Verticillium longisporum TaxID=100787 RepID=A0A0G4MB09_VERLO|nr:hypothetical protein BN1708_005481 [Verticillium longisporum]